MLTRNKLHLPVDSFSLQYVILLDVKMLFPRLKLIKHKDVFPLQVMFLVAGVSAGTSSVSPIKSFYELPLSSLILRVVP